MCLSVVVVFNFFRQPLMPRAPIFSNEGVNGAHDAVLFLVEGFPHCLSTVRKFIGKKGRLFVPTGCIGRVAFYLFIFLRLSLTVYDSGHQLLYF